jgi:hypothetical protein
MNNFKNLLIATLTGLLALSLFSQPAQSASNSTAKAIEYDNCLGIGQPANTLVLDSWIKMCKKYRP